MRDPPRDDRERDHRVAATYDGRVSSSEGFSCPSCGWELPYGTPTCGNCGTDLRPYYGGPLAGPTGTRVPSGVIRLLVVATIVLGAGFFLVDPIRDAVDDFTENFEGFGSGVDPAEPEVVEEEPVVAGYRNVRALVRALNAGGLRCGRVVVDQSDEFLSTGSCQASGTHVQINIYRQTQVLESAREIFKEGPFTWVHDDGWFVITQTSVARRAHEILGGRLRVAN